MMYVKHFVTCKALCTCVGDCSHYGHYYYLIIMGGRASKQSPWGSGLGACQWWATSMDFQRIFPGRLPSGDHKLCLDGWGSRPPGEY